MEKGFSSSFVLFTPNGRWEERAVSCLSRLALSLSSAQLTFIEFYHTSQISPLEGNWCHDS